MTAILDGRPIAAEIEREVRSQAAGLARRGILPGLAICLFGNDSPSRVYGRMIARGCERVGVRFRIVEGRAEEGREAAERLIESLNRDPEVHGILVKRPLPPPLDDEEILQRTIPAKDVDGYHFENVGRLVVGGPHQAPVPCTPAGVLELLRRSGVDLSGRHVVVLGRSATVGRPLSNLLSQKDGANATVTLCHGATRRLEEHTRRADIVVCAVGRPGFLRREMVAPGAVVVDVGTNVVKDPESPKGYRLVGDADYESLLGHVSAITPVPGGVGPVTVAALLRNVVEAAQRLEAGGVD